MGLILFPITNAIAPLLLFFDGGVQPQHANHDRIVAADAPSSIIIAANNNNEPARSAGVGNNNNAPYSWNLPNGNVQFDRPLTFTGIKVQNNDGQLTSDDDSSSSISLWNPTFLGSGGSGAVFSFSAHPNTNNLPQKIVSHEQSNVAIKVSWKRSRASVENECSILQSLENVPHVERCLGRPNPYPYEEGRVMIALSPVVSSSSSDDITSSLSKVKHGTPQRMVVKSIVETMVGMLRLGIYTIDVQPLISVETGEVLFIDFTEARHFSAPVSPSDESAIVGFCSEMIALIPDSLKDVAVEDLKTELKYGLNDRVNDRIAMLPEKVVDILESIWID